MDRSKYINRRAFLLLTLAACSSEDSYITSFYGKPVPKQHKKAGRIFLDMLLEDPQVTESIHGLAYHSQKGCEVATAYSLTWNSKETLTALMESPTFARFNLEETNWAPANTPDNALNMLVNPTDSFEWYPDKFYMVKLYISKKDDMIDGCVIANVVGPFNNRTKRQQLSEIKGL